MFRRKARKEEKAVSIEKPPEPVAKPEPVEVIPVPVVPSGPLIIVDASNTAYGNGMGSSKPSLRFLNIVIEELKRSGIKTIFVADATLRHKITEQEDFESLLNHETVIQVPARTSADDYIWLMAKLYHKDGRRVSIVTNDLFPIHKGQNDKITGIERMTFMFADDRVIFQPPLEELLKPDGSKQGTRTEKKGQQPRAKKQAETVTPKAPVQPKKTDLQANPLPSVIPEELLITLRNFVKGRNQQLGKKINFAVVSNHLHAKYDGNFCKHFGYRRPKDLATLLEVQGYVSLSHVGPTLYIEATEKLTSENK